MVAALQGKTPRAPSTPPTSSPTQPRRQGQGQPRTMARGPRRSPSDQVMTTTATTATAPPSEGQKSMPAELPPTPALRAKSKLKFKLKFKLERVVQNKEKYKTGKMVQIMGCDPTKR